MTQIKVGDKIVATSTQYPSAVPNGTLMTVIEDRGDGDVLATVDGSADSWDWFMTVNTYEPYVKETPMAQTTQEPKLWKDMTPEEKGALLLADHEGKAIEAWAYGDKWLVLVPEWDKHTAYRVKPEPVVETVTLYGFNSYGHWIFGRKEQEDTHKITLTIRDGVVDPIAQVEEL